MLSSSGYQKRTLQLHFAQLQTCSWEVDCFKLELAKSVDHPVKVGLGTDGRWNQLFYPPNCE